MPELPHEGYESVVVPLQLARVEEQIEQIPEVDGDGTEYVLEGWHCRVNILQPGQRAGRDVLRTVGEDDGGHQESAEHYPVAEVGAMVHVAKH